jgi:hypothetical protein
VTSELSSLITNAVNCLKQEIVEARDNSMEIDSQGHQQTDETLVMLRDFWLQFCAQMKSVSDAFLFLERSYLAGPQNVSIADDLTEIAGRNLSPVGHVSFWQIGLKFVRLSISSIDLKDQLINGILLLIQKERTFSTQDNRNLCQQLVQILLALGLYKGEFEDKFLESSRVFYQQKQRSIEESLSMFLV